MADSSVSTSSGTTRQVDDDASEILEQRRASLRYFNNNFYGEWVEIYQSMKARVTPRMVTMEDGTKVVDTSRTNVALPDHFVMVRNGTARLTRNPPNLRMRGTNKDAADKAGAQLMYQWDRGEAQKAFKTITRQAKALGWAIGKSYYDKIEFTRKFKRYTKDLTRAELMRHQGAPQDEIDDATAEAPETGGTPLEDHEKTAAIAEHGDVVSTGFPVTKYEGPVLTDVFVGDFYPEPGFKSLNDSSGFQIESGVRDEDWLEYWTEQVTTNPETGKEQPIISKEAAARLMEMAGDRNYIDEKDTSLRRQMRSAVKVGDPQTEGRFKTNRKRFLVDERESIIDGKLVIEYVGEESVYLGKQWFPYDLYGRTLYSEMVLIPDILGGIGDSTPRITRFLMQLRNARFNATTDLINNKLEPFVKALEGNNFTQKDLRRNGAFRVLTVRNMGEIEVMQDGAFPGEAWEDQAQLVREMQQVEPASQNYAPGTDTIPDAGKLATTAVLAQKSSDNVLADELSQQGQFVRDVCEKWVWMNQQAMEDDLTINPGDVPRLDAMSLRTDGGAPRAITISPMDIQEELEVLPEEGSTLADDDEYRVKALQQGFMLAAQNPDVFNKRGIGQKLLQTMPGISVEEGMAPPPPPQPPTQPPRVGINITAKWTDFAPDVQEALLEGVGLPSEGTRTLSTLHHGTEAITKIAGAADAATELERPVDYAGGDGAAGDAGKPSADVRTPKGLGGSK